VVHDETKRRSQCYRSISEPGPPGLYARGGRVGPGDNGVQRASAVSVGQIPQKREVVVVTFGGGSRDEETFAPEGRANIPRMLHELMPQASFFTRVQNNGILGHSVATASLATRVCERFNNFADVSPDNPTLFEYFRRQTGRPATDAWVVAPSNGFNRIGQSSQPLHSAASNTCLTTTTNRRSKRPSL
jgi:hypothetical protein